MRGRLAEDVTVVRAKDPAATSTVEILLYPHLHALWLHRLAHVFYRRRHRVVARALAQLGRLVSGGIEIHPGATLGRRLFIDHGVGVVIGETAEVGDDTMLYHGVTLGSCGWWRDMAPGHPTKRHPTVGNNVVLGTGVSVLGPVVVGDHSRVGAHAIILTDLPPGSSVPAGTVVKAQPEHPRPPAQASPTAHSPTRPQSEGASSVPHTTGQVLITCAPPNPNGDLHLGHLSGPFLGADVLRRYLSARGVPAQYVSYTDDESCYVPRRAAELGENARDTAFRFTNRIAQTLSLADMSPDYYAHPHREPRHQKVVQSHFRQLYDAGLIEERTLPTPFCEQCDRFLYEADLRGVCRFCKLPCDGTYCEDCGFPQDPRGVLDGHCTRCGTTPVNRPTRRLVLPLADYTDRLASLYGRSSWSGRVLEFCQEMLAMGLPDTPVSRVYPYGIPVPLKGWEDHVLDTWFSGIYGYMAATEGLGIALGDAQFGARLWDHDETTLVHFIGFDCSFSHAVLWPAMLLATDAKVLPRHIISNEFYQLEGEKFSTSRGHAIWGSDFLREMPADAVRFHLCRTSPETESSNFSRAEFDESLKVFLAERLEGWAASLFDQLREAGSTVPDAAVSEWPAPVRQLIERLPNTVASTLEPATFSLRRTATTIADSVNWASNDFRVVRTDGGMTGDDRRAALAAHAELLAVTAAVAAPLMPTWSSRVWAQLRSRPVNGAPPWPEPGDRLLAAGQPAAATYQASFAAR